MGQLASATPSISAPGHSTYPSSNGGSTGGVSLHATTPSGTNTYISNSAASVTSSGTTTASSKIISAAPKFDTNGYRNTTPSVSGSVASSNVTSKKGGWSKPSAGPKKQTVVDDKQDEDYVHDLGDSSDESD
jgi:hypothetical protein